MGEFKTKPLDEETWDAFARLVEKHNGVWGGCWCTWFHAERYDKEAAAAEGGKSMKLRLVQEGRAHAALVFDGDAAVGWCQYGTKSNASLLYSATRSMFETAGFEYERPKGKNHCVMRTTIKASKS